MVIFFIQITIFKTKNLFFEKMIILEDITA